MLSGANVIYIILVTLKRSMQEFDSYDFMTCSKTILLSWKETDWTHVSDYVIDIQMITVL